MTQPFAPPPAAPTLESLARLLPLADHRDGSDVAATRRALVLAPLLAALPLALAATPAAAIDGNQTQVMRPDQFQWKPWSGAPPNSSETAALFGATDKPGLYAVAIRWHPGYMSAPHSYATDRLCFVLSGTWWVNSGRDFDPNATVSVPAGGFVRRVARTWHYDGVKKGEKEPVVIGIIGQAPIDIELAEPGKPPWRAV